jgi:hypothetical protein
MFPKAKKAKLDTAALGAKLLKRKMELMEQMGISEGEEGEAPKQTKRKSARK